MSDDQKPTLDEIARWARRYGLDKLAPAHLQRMTELAVYVSDLGRSLPRAPRKEDSPTAPHTPK